MIVAILTRIYRAGHMDKKASIISLQISSFHALRWRTSVDCYFHVESSLLTAVFSRVNIRIFRVRKARFTYSSDTKRSACLSPKSTYCVHEAFLSGKIVILSRFSRAYRGLNNPAVWAVNPQISSF